MALPKRISQFGNQMAIEWDNGTKTLAYPTGQGYWLVSGSGDDPDPGTDPVEPGDIYNPYGTNISNGGDWESHLDRTGRGGIDWPKAYRTPIKAPAAGVLKSAQTGGFSDTDTGSVGAAGLRSILVLDTPVTRTKPAGPNEAAGPMTRIVFQHQAELGEHNAHFDRGQVLGYSGDSGNNVTHLHVHGLDAAGARVDFMKFV